MPHRTEVRRVDPSAPDAKAIARAAEILRSGGLVAFPTETVYGLGANALSADAVQGIFTAKGRPANNPLIVHVADVAAARELASEWPPTVQQLADRFWPGPLSLVLSKRACVPAIVTAGATTVALRVPAHPVALAVIRAAGVPIAAPSANRSNEVSPTRAEHVLKGLDGRIDLILDGGPTSGGLESTVIDVSAHPPKLLRPGLVTRCEIEAVIGTLQQASLKSNEQAALPSPGMLSRHYAPRAILECVADDGFTRVEQLMQRDIRVGWLAMSDIAVAPAPNVVLMRMPRDPIEYSAELYAALHSLDAAGVERIVVELPPHLDAWAAVHDRLRRAACAGVPPSGGPESG